MSKWELRFAFALLVIGASQPARGATDPTHDLGSADCPQGAIPAFFQPVLDPIPITPEIRQALNVNGASTVISMFDALTDFGAFLSLNSVDAAGSLTYLVSGATSEKKAYTTTQDLVWSTVVPIKRENNLWHYYRVGVGFRVRANFATSKKSINVSGLIPLGVAASKNDLTGSVSVQQIGFSGRDLLGTVPTLSDLSAQSITLILGAVETAKAKVWDGVHAVVASDAEVASLLADCDKLQDGPPLADGTVFTKAAFKAGLQPVLQRLHPNYLARITIEPRILAIGICLQPHDALGNAAWNEIPNEVRLKVPLT